MYSSAHLWLQSHIRVSLVQLSSVAISSITQHIHAKLQHTNMSYILRHRGTILEHNIVVNLFSLQNAISNKMLMTCDLFTTSTLYIDEYMENMRNIFLN